MPLIDFVPPDGRRVFYVVFTESDQHGFWNVFTSKKYSHCLALTDGWYPRKGLLSQRLTMKIEGGADAMHTDLWSMDVHLSALWFIHSGATDVVRIEVDINHNRSYVPRGLYSCVGIIKAWLWIRAWYVWTPGQLHRWLKRHGGVSLREAINDGPVQ